VKQVITRDGIVICVTSVPYPAFIIRDMKNAGYKIRTEESNDRSKKR
jgi:hypothetical protein